MRVRPCTRRSGWTRLTSQPALTIDTIEASRNAGPKTEITRPSTARGTAASIRGDIDVSPGPAKSPYKKIRSGRLALEQAARDPQHHGRAEDEVSDLGHRLS